MSSTVPNMPTVPSDGDEELLHSRGYRVDVYRVDDTRMRLRGRLSDVKPMGLWFLPDDEPMTVHDMYIDVVVEVPSMQITSVETSMATHPNTECATINSAYEQLVGTSIARGFTHKVRELFGGPRGCTHVTALLQAMAPAAIQSLGSMLRDPETGQWVQIRSDGERETQEDLRRRQLERNRNTCHVWAEGGPMFERIDRGEEVPAPVWGIERLRERGYEDPEAEWHRAVLPADTDQ